ncbi:MAG: UDP-N-acetylmuramoyl-tripeptide--D-alanyl-D-alanine ligase [Clostridia bacterium]|nr:UDP-N-acetylmuramoyl-tripeptide--D-alanyl-D-alanine ligase [Clostridia bacterium]
MNRLFLNIAFVCVIAAFLILLRHQFHMLQLSSYRNDRYKKWAKENFGKELTVWYIFPVLVPCIIVMTSLPLWVFTACFAVTLALAVIFTPRKAEKKKLVITARVKRLYVTATVLSLIMLTLLNLVMGRNLFGYSDRFWVFVLFWISVFAVCYRTVATRLINFINAPIEKAVARYYINDAKKVLASSSVTVIGITGSYGKTSTKYILEKFLSQKFNTLMTPESYNTPLGAVRTVREHLLPTHKYFICEMGAKQVGDIKEICDIVHPTHCIITSIGPCHLENFGSMENIVKTKFELYDACDGIKIIGADIEKECEGIRAGTSGDYFAKDISYNENGMTFTLVAKGKEIEISTSLLGMSGVKNIVTAAAMAMELGVPAEDIRFACARLKAVPHRLEINRKSANYIVIDDAFNSNPAGASEALSVLSSFEGYTRVVITPGMVELGEKTYELNRELGVKAKECADYIIAVGKNAEAIKEGADNAIVVKNLNEALGKLQTLMGEKTVVLFENDLPDNYEE